MNNASTARVLAALVVLIGASTPGPPAVAQQSSMIAQKVAEAKQLMVVNREQLSKYTWQLQQTVSVSGDVKKEDVYTVQLGPDGQQMRALVAQPVAPPSGGRQHGIKHRMKEDFEQYAQQVGELAKSYAQLNPARVQQLYAAGNVSVRSGGAPGYTSVVIANYNKPGDSVVLTLSDKPTALYSVNVTSYLSSPSDGVTMQVRYASLPDGTHYASTTTVNGQSKNLTIVDQAMNFAPRTQ